MPAEVAAGLLDGGDGGVEGQGGVEAVALGGHLPGELVGGVGAVAHRGLHEGAEDAVVGVDAVGAVGGDKLAELLEEGEVALGGVGVAGAEVDAGAADQAVEARVQDAVQHGDGAVLEGAEPGVVLLEEAQGLRGWDQAGWWAWGDGGPCVGRARP